jgi:sugar lactone lactonase YvrE
MYYVSNPSVAPGRLTKLSASGKTLEVWSGLRNPGGVAVGTDGTVYVAEQDQNRIDRFTATGRSLVPWSDPTG